VSDSQLQLAALEPKFDDVSVDDVQLVGSERSTGVGEGGVPERGLAAIAERYLAAEADRIAARASTAGTRRQYGSIYRSFATWLAAQLGRPPLVADLDADVIATYRRHLTVCGGRGGAPAAPATVRVYVSMIRALASELGLKDQAADVRVPRHEPGPPETLTEVDYQNLSRVPDRRSREGKRDRALLALLGGCGLRSAELRRLRAEDLRRPRSNARHFRLYVHGKGGREREVSVPEVVKDAMDAWVKVHPLAYASGLRDEHPLFVRLGRHGREDPEPLSAEAVYRLVNRHCLAAGVPDRLAHPHALRSYWATRLLESGAPVHAVSARLGHVDLRTTARYAAVREHSADELADATDRDHQRARRGW
jgi:integrase/recombinase XerD